jgi:folylpolyglutamate synthase/dihydropteroate synthase
MDTLDGALKSLSGLPGRVLICGSLYLAGEVLHRNAA